MMREVEKKMREIKFRAWDTVLSKFFDGDILNDYNLGDFLNDDRYIVTQYTGLKDINGVEIYEGDIVNHFYRYYVGMDEVSEEMEVVEIKDLTHLPFDLSTIGCEAIGNIYENKELLEVKGNE